MQDKSLIAVRRRYEHFEQQLRVARAFAAFDPARSFEVLDPGISQLNELLAAAAVLSGFEINMFRDGEMAMQGGNGLTNMVNRFGQELAELARSDFERSETLAGRFQFAGGENHDASRDRPGIAPCETCYRTARRKCDYSAGLTRLAGLAQRSTKGEKN